MYINSLFVLLSVYFQRKQVFNRVEARADELNVKPPSHMTVYRILQLIIVQA
ncbi:hypothetical protein [Chamaesiphon minutus]|uniref:hypothetical protein n=1 Tax=Chamaesiphon minutus TaxID=1173032 RepID=UPI0002ED5F7E|nr:hypothetical protein [Chamaesiphon minutus]